MPPSPPTDPSHAIVIGGSLAGLLAARALAGYFRRVTLIERDAFPDGPAHRSGVPQARHLHVLLLKGKAILEDFFPGFEQELLEAGAIPADVGSEFLTVSIFGRVAPVQTGQHLLLCSRYLIEWSVRRRLAALGNIHFLTRAEAAGLLPGAGGRSVGGVRIEGRGGQPAPERLPAELVVDCSGRGSPAADWLAGLGYAPPQATVVNSHLGYATRWYRRAGPLPALADGAFKGAIVAVRPPDNPRGGALFPAEGGLWIATLAGTAGQVPPTDEAGFLEFARQLADPAIYETIRTAEPASPVYGYRRTENQWRHYERLSAWPAGFVVMGDAACCFNPVYGQGMTAAALGAALLDEMLAGAGGRITPRFGLSFQRRLARRLQTPWLMATGEDFRWKATEGPPPGPAARLVQAYFDRVIRLALHNQTASRAFIQVAHLLQPPASLFRPDVLLAAISS